MNPDHTRLSHCHLAVSAAAASSALAHEQRVGSAGGWIEAVAEYFQVEPVMICPGLFAALLTRPRFWEARLMIKTF